MEALVTSLAATADLRAATSAAEAILRAETHTRQQVGVACESETERTGDGGVRFASGKLPLVTQFELLAVSLRASMSTPGARSAANYIKNDAWRNHPLLKATWSSTVPGFRLGLGLFVAYVALEKGYEAVRGPKKDEHHGHGHGGAHGKH